MYCMYCPTKAGNKYLMAESPDEKLSMSARENVGRGLGSGSLHSNEHFCRLAGAFQINVGKVMMTGC